jgi:hypothetical protein
VVGTDRTTIPTGESPGEELSIHPEASFSAPKLRHFEVRANITLKPGGARASLGYINVKEMS